MSTRSAFTLIELLVVVTIIVILLALLVPAMDRAIYRAELLVCASQLRGIGVSVTTYANEYKRYYPYRGLTADRDANGRPSYYDQPAELKYHPAVTMRPFDQRQTLRVAMPALSKQMNDPLTEFIDLEADAEVVFSSYNLWWGFTFFNPGTQKSMNKLGDFWTYDNERFNVLAGDRDLVRPGVDAQSSHADGVYGAGILRQLYCQNAQGPWLIAPGRMTISLWYSDPADITTGYTNHERGLLDNNYVMSDGSVAQFDRVHHDRFKELGRIRTVSTYSNGWRGPEYDYMFVP